jgi:hypothetical protein
MATKLSETNLASTRQLIDSTLLPTLEDADLVETALSKTEDGMVYEIRYKAPGKMWRQDALTVNGLYEKLRENNDWDKMRETVEGLAVNVGRLAAYLVGLIPMDATIAQVIRVLFIIVAILAVLEAFGFTHTGLLSTFNFH